MRHYSANRFRQPSKIGNTVDAKVTETDTGFNDQEAESVRLRDRSDFVGAWIDECTKTEPLNNSMH